MPLEVDYSRWLRLSLLKGYGNVGWYDISTVQYCEESRRGEMNGKAGVEDRCFTLLLMTFYVE